MGCGGSKNDVVKQNSGGNSKGSAPLTVSEIEKRIEAPKDTHVVNHAGINMKYAWVSQRGYYPDGKICMFGLYSSTFYNRSVFPN